MRSTIPSPLLIIWLSALSLVYHAIQWGVYVWYDGLFSSFGGAIAPIALIIIHCLIIDRGVNISCAMYQSNARVHKRPCVQSDDGFPLHLSDREVRFVESVSGVNVCISGKQPISGETAYALKQLAADPSQHEISKMFKGGSLDDIILSANANTVARQTIVSALQSYMFEASHQESYDLNMSAEYASQTRTPLPHISEMNRLERVIWTILDNLPIRVDLSLLGAVAEMIVNQYRRSIITKTKLYGHDEMYGGISDDIKETIKAYLPIEKTLICHMPDDDGVYICYHGDIANAQLSSVRSSIITELSSKTETVSLDNSGSNPNFTAIGDGIYIHSYAIGRLTDVFSHFGCESVNACIDGARPCRYAKLDH